MTGTIEIWIVIHAHNLVIARLLILLNFDDREVMILRLKQIEKLRGVSLYHLSKSFRN